MQLHTTWPNFHEDNWAVNNMVTGVHRSSIYSLDFFHWFSFPVGDPHMFVLWNSFPVLQTRRTWDSCSSVQHTRWVNLQINVSRTGPLAFWTDSWSYPLLACDPFYLCTRNLDTSYQVLPHIISKIARILSWGNWARVSVLNPKACSQMVPQRNQLWTYRSHARVLGQHIYYYGFAGSAIALTEKLLGCMSVINFQCLKEVQ